MRHVLNSIVSQIRFCTQSDGCIKVSSQNLTHNHARLEDFAKFDVSARRLTAREKIEVKSLRESGVKVKSIARVISKHRGGSNDYVLPKDIYNFVSEDERKQSGGVPDAVNLLRTLQADRQAGCLYSLTQDNKLSNLLFWNETSLAMFQTLPEVLSIDATYRTNRCVV